MPVHVTDDAVDKVASFYKAKAPTLNGVALTGASVAGGGRS